MTVTLRQRNRQAAMDSVRGIAFELMTEHGFDAVTVEQIAAASNVSPSTVYRYFGTKEALVLSSERPRMLVERLANDDSQRGPFEAVHRAAVKVWGGDDGAATEIGLASANNALVEKFERQLLDQRGVIAAHFAERRGKTSPGTKDDAQAAAAIAVLMSALLDWQKSGGGSKQLDKLLSKSYAAVTAG